MIYTSVEQLIGYTPLLELRKAPWELPARILVKMERSNPGGSSKDRAALFMIRSAEESGQLKPGSVIIEPTSGNTGIALAMLGAIRGYQVIIVMPDSMSKERRQLIAAYGAKLVLTPGSEGMTGAVKRAEQLQSSIPGSFIPSQFTNPAGATAHHETTGPEIWEDTQGKLDFFVSGVGTGGTLTGAGHYLKEQNPGIQVVAVEPAASPLLSCGKSGPHGLQGIGANFIPPVLDVSLADEVMTVTEQQAIDTCRRLGRTEGLLVGISSGAALWAAMEVGKRPQNRGKTIVALLPDGGERYLSSHLF